MHHLGPIHLHLDIKEKKGFLFWIFILFSAFTFCLNSGALAFKVKAHAHPDTICQGQYSQLSVTIQGGPGPFTYLWSPTATLSDPDISDPLASPLVTTMYHVLVTDQFSNTARDSIILYVETIPPPPSPITGPDAVCSDTTCFYSVTPYAGATSYSWTVPSGAIIISGQNTDSIQLQWGTISGTVSVIIGNTCGTSVPSVISVNVTVIPPAPSGIQGPSHLCSLDTTVYKTDTLPETASYQWTFPAGVTILNGAGTNSIRVIWGETSGNISVAGENSCGIGPSIIKTVELDSLPSKPGNINGPDTVCTGKGNYSYFISPVNFASSYEWSLPPGALIGSGQKTNRISVDFSDSASTGSIAVHGVNACGNGDFSSKVITVINCSGIEENKLNSKVIVSPNPIDEKLFIEISGTETRLFLFIYNLQGETVFQEYLSGIPSSFNHEIDASQFTQGIYLLKIANEHGSAGTKFIVR
jgi:hypothetical protein